MIMMIAQTSPVKMVVDVLIMLVTSVVIVLVLATAEKDVKTVRSTPIRYKKLRNKPAYCHNRKHIFSFIDIV